MSKSPSLLPAADLLLSWTQIIELLRLEDPWKRAFYENECVRGNWDEFAGVLDRAEEK